MKRKIFTFSLLLAGLLTAPAYAQQDANASAPAPKKDNTKVSIKTIEIKGVVYDAATKAPLAGIQLQTLQDNRFAAMTNPKGEFSIKVPEYASALYVFAPQFLSQQVAIDHNAGQGEGMAIYLLPDRFKPMYDNSTSIIAAPEVAVTSATAMSVESEIQNNLGADVNTVSRNGGPGYGASMNIRGLNSLNANSQPLIVLDGIVQDMQTTRTSLHYGDYNNLMLNINPADIEKVQVLKNGTSLYGAKGANGVILITTKRGRSMATRIEANVAVGVSLIPRLPQMMDADQYRLYASEMVGTHPLAASLKGETLHFLNDDPSKFYYKTYHNNTDWTKEVYRTALTQNYNIQVQGGDTNGMYNLSLGYTDGQSTAKSNGFDRLNVRFNTDIKILEKLKTAFDLSFTKTNRDVFDNGSPAEFYSAPVSSPTMMALVKAPFLHPYAYNNITGQLSTTPADADDFLSALDESITLGNPTALLKYGLDENNKNNRVEMTHFNATIAPRFDFTKYLYLQETFSYGFDRISESYYRPLGGMPLFTVAGIGTVQNLSMSLFSKNEAVQSDTRLRFYKNMGAHYLDAFIGFRYQNFSYNSNSPWGEYTTAGNDKVSNLSSSMDFKGMNGEDMTSRSFSWYANADYNYANRYFAQFTLTGETSSRIGVNSPGMKLFGVRWGIFPSLQLGWNITNEKFFPKTDAVNHILIHVGYDKSGNDDINSSAAKTFFTPLTYLDRAEAAVLNNIGNDKITFEKVTKCDVGVKANFLRNRLSLIFDYFVSNTTDLLSLKTFSNPIAGINRYWSNGGSMKNTGFEATITGKPVVMKDFNMELGVSIGHYKNKITALPDNTTLFVDGQPVQGYTSSIYGDDNIATMVGYSAGVFYGYKTQGVFSTDAEAKAAGKGGYLYLLDNTGAKQYFKAGDVHFVDINGDGVISEADKTVIGNPNPKFYGNMFINASWKDLYLTIGFNYSLGNDVFNYQRSILEGGSNFYNQTTAMASRWRNEGDVTAIPRASYGDPLGNSRFSDRWIEDGGYLRLKTINLTYKIPVQLSWLQGLAVWLQADNVFTVTKYLGSDPEFSAGNGTLYRGIDPGNVALGRAFYAGVKINL